MIEDDLRMVLAEADKRDGARQAWLRHLHLLAAGCLRTTWVPLGCSILLGGVALYGETARHAALCKMIAEQTKKHLRKESASGIGGLPVVANKPLWLRGAEASFLTSLCVATIALVAFALAR